MLNMRYFLLVSFSMLVTSMLKAADEQPVSIHAIMMESTCKLTGKESMGSGFILGKPLTSDPARLLFTLVTAHHVFAGMKEDEVIVTLRRQKDQDHWERVDVRLQIRKAGKELWYKHPDVDLAVIHLGLPEGMFKNGLLPSSSLLSDDKLRQFEVGPGTELLCLGYPLGAESNKEGFAILRSGKIASYPLVPTKETKTFLFDFTVFQGNSGGPVYLCRENPVIRGGTVIGQFTGLIGIVTSEQNVVQKIEQLYEHREVRTPLALAGVIPAEFIKEAIASLPEPDSAVK